MEPHLAWLTAASERDGIAWLRAHLLGDDRLVPSATVRVMITGERTGGGWRELPAWPPHGTGEWRLFLDDAGALSDHPATTSGADRYRYDPADPTPSLGGPILLERTAVVDNAALEAREDVLTYTTGPLEQTVEAIGHVSVELWARADGPSFDLFARVCDVDAEGVARNVSDAMASVASGRTAQDADGAWHVSFELCVADRPPLDVLRGAEHPSALVLPQL